MISPSNKFIHTADVHLMAGDQRELSLDAFRQVAALADRLAVDAVLVSGDLYDRAVDNTENSPLGEAVEIMTAARQEWVLLDGNHDPRRSLRLHHNPPGGVYVIDSPQQILLKCGLLVSGMPYPDKGFLLAGSDGRSVQEANAEMLEGLRNIFMGFLVDANQHPGVPHVGMFHGNVKGSVLHNGQIMLQDDLLVPAEFFGLTGATYTALGHIHKPQQMGFGAYYSGSPWAVDFGDLGQKGVYHVTVTANGHEQTWIPIATPVKHTEDVQANEIASDLASWDWVDKFDPAPGGDNVQRVNVDLKLRVAVPRDLAGQLDAEAIRGKAAAHGFRSVRIERNVQRTERIRAAELSEATRLRDKVVMWATATNTIAPSQALDSADEFEVAYRTM